MRNFFSFKTVIVSLVGSLFISGCYSTPKVSKSTFTASRSPASTQDLLDGSERILQDLQNQEVFNSDSCYSYIDSFTSSVFSLPSGHFFPKNQAEVTLLKAKGPQLLQNLFDARLRLHSKLKEFKSSGSLDDRCINAIREGGQYLRYAEDFVLEWLVEQKAVPGNPPRILETQFPHTVWNKKFSQFQLQAGDVMMVRGQSYVSAMIARIGDEEGNFSHLAIVASDAKGKLYAAESLIQKGLVITPLDEWRKMHDSRVALYRHPDTYLAQRASRVIYDHAMSFIKKGTTKRYDFTMNDADDSAFFCSEVIGWAYKQASEGRVILPEHRSQTTKFEKTQYFEDLGIKRGSLFAPFDIEVDTRFEFIAEYRYLPLLRQVRMQDAVLQSVYDWMIKKDYDFHAAPDLSVKAVMAKIVRQFGLAKDKLPTYMPYKTLLTTLKYEGVATVLEKNLYAKEAAFYREKGHSMTFKDLMAINEEFRRQDCQKQKEFAEERSQISGEGIPEKPSSDFHWFFYGDLKSCN